MDIPLVTPKKPNVGDYLRSGSCTGDPQVSANFMVICPPFS